MNSIQIKLFGALEIDHPAQTPRQPAAHTVLALLGYLIVHRRGPQPREKLATLLWPDLSPRHGRRKLSDALWRIRRLLTVDLATDTPLLVVAGDSVMFQSVPGVQIDLIQFEQLTAPINEWEATREDWAPATQPILPPSSSTIEQLQAAITLYRGDFLEACYDDWAVFERERLRERYLSTLQHLLSYYQSISSYEAALQMALRLSHADPLREDTHQALLQIYYLLGREADAIHTYEQFRALLATELDMEPDPETTALYEEIMRRRKPQMRVSAPVLLSQHAPTPGNQATAHQLIEVAYGGENKQMQTLALMTAAEFELERGDLRQAFALATEGLQIGRQAGLYPLLGRVLRVLALTRAADTRHQLPNDGEVVTAEEGFRQSIALLEETRYDCELGITLARYGEWLLLQERCSDAQAALHRAQILLAACAMQTELASVQMSLQRAKPLRRPLEASGLPGRMHMLMARIGAPMGRALRPEELVSVLWTLQTDEDSRIYRAGGKVALRRHCLRRLCAEANAQGAEPTIADLAQALHTTPRTVSRDLAALRAAGETIHTRGHEEPQLRG